MSFHFVHQNSLSFFIDASSWKEKAHGKTASNKKYYQYHNVAYGKLLFSRKVMLHHWSVFFPEQGLFFYQFWFEFYKVWHNLRIFSWIFWSHCNCFRDEKWCSITFRTGIEIRPLFLWLPNISLFSIKVYPEGCDFGGIPHKTFNNKNIF